MNETDWQGGGDVTAMLDELGDRLSVRKLRLFCVACVRRVWGQVTNPQSRRAVEVAERFAEGRATEAERAQAEEQARYASYDDSYFQIPALQAVVHILAWDIRTGRQAPAPAEGEDPVAPEDLEELAPEEVPAGGVREALRALVQLAGLHAREGAAFPGEEIALGREAVLQENAAQAALLREMVGNPYRPVVLHPLWLHWSDQLIPNLARVLLDERRFDDLPILADALEDAGCDDRSLLDHLRSGCPHYPGCWALDLILGQS
jgi:hypothetical protein